MAVGSSKDALLGDGAPPSCHDLAFQSCVCPLPRSAAAAGRQCKEGERL